MKLSETSLPVLHIPEPPLEFSYGQKSPYPKDGLFLYGPHLKPPKTPHLSIGVIGSCQGVAHLKDWAKKLKGRIEVPPRSGARRRTAFISLIFPVSRRRLASPSIQTRLFPVRLIRRSSMKRRALLICTRLSERRSKSTSQRSSSTTKTKNEK
jgi:hypothetical protein